MAVHFPVFSDAISKLSTSAGQFEVWMLKAGLKRLEGKLDTLNEGLKEAYQPYMEARNALLTALREYARREFQ